MLAAGKIIKTNKLLYFYRLLKFNQILGMIRIETNREVKDSRPGVPIVFASILKSQVRSGGLLCKKIRILNHMIMGFY